MNFDDLPDDTPPPEQATAGQPAADNSPSQLRFDDLPSFDDMPSHAPDSDQSPLGTFAEHTALRSPVGAAGGVGALYGARVGGTLGAMAAPFVGPLAPAAPAIGAFGGALIGGFGTGWLASKPVDWVLDKLGLNDSLQSGAQQNPNAAFLGDLTGNTLPAFGAGAASLATRGIGAAAGAGIEAASEASGDEPMSPGKIIAAGAMNAAFPRARGWAEGAAGRIPIPFKGTGTGAIQNPVAEEGQPGRPDLKAIPTEGADADEITVANDITTTAPGVAAANPPAPEIEGAGNPTGAPMLARSASRPNDPSRNYGKGATLGTSGVTTAETTALSTAPIHEDISAALKGDEPPIETGLAQQASPPLAATLPQSIDPVEAAQLQRTGLQNVKANMAAQQQGEAFQPEAGRTPGMDPDRAAAPVQPEVDAGLLQAATQRAMRRNIMFAPMPSIANSGKANNSPVVIDPIIKNEFPEAVRPLAVHETVEQALMAKGMPYEQAHHHATQAEKAAFERQTRGITWDEYTERMAGLAKKIEAQKVDPASYAQMDLHVDPEQAIGHHADKGNVTGAVTREQQGHIDAVRAELQQPGMEEALTRFDALPPAQQAAAAARGVAARDEAPAPEKPASKVPGSEHMMVETRNRRETALAAWERAYELHGPETGPLDAGDKTAILKRARDAFDTAKEANGGMDPLKAYKPFEKPPGYKWLSAARAAATRPTAKNIEAFLAAHALSGETGHNIEGEITNKVIPDLGENQVHATGDVSHETFDPIKDVTAGKDNSYVEAQNKVREFVNDLPDEQFQRLAKEYDLGAELDQPADPESLLGNFKETLADTGKRPGVIELVPAEEARAKPRPIRNKADLDRFQATEPGAPATAGRSLDKNSPEFKAAAEAALKQQTKGITVGDRAEREEAAALSNSDERTLNVEAIRGAWGDTAKKFGRMMGDESGAGKPIPVPEWLKQRVNDWFSPTASDDVKATVHELNKQFNINEGAVKNMDMRLAANFAAAPEKTLNDRAALYHKLENGTALTADEQKYYDDYVKPLVDWHDRLYKMHRRDNPDLPEQFGGVSKKFVPRLTTDALAPLDRNEPWKRTLSDWAGALEDRQWFALDDGAGKRLTFHLAKDADGDLELHVLRKGSDQLVSGLPDTFTGQPGDKLALNVGGKKSVFTVDHAAVPEIERDVPGVKFVKDPLITYSNSIRGMQSAMIRKKMLEQIKDNEIFKDNSTTDKDVARKEGYALEPTILDDLSKRGGQPLYMDKRLKWTLDDFAKPGISDSVFDPVRRFAGNMAKGLYFLSPPFHVINVADNWAHAMASDAIKFREYPKMAAEQLTAIRSVLTQDALQHEMRAAGGKPMLPTQLLDGGLIQQMMQKAGMQVAKNPSFLDPLAKATGIAIPDMLHSAMVQSNKIMWGGNDMFLTSLYLRNKRLGMDPGTAMAEAHKWIGSYRPESPTFGGSRVLQKIVNDPAISWFGPYHQDLWRSYGNIIKGLVGGKDVTPQQRKDAVGALVMSGVLMFGVYPYMLDKGAQLLTGNEQASFGRRGMSALQDAAYHLVKGDKTYTNLAANVWTPSIPANMFIHGIENKDWTGKDIVPAAPLYKPGELAKATARATDWLAQQAVPPYATLSSEERQPEASMGSVVKKFGEAAVGIKDPSEASQKFNEQLERHQNTEAKKRERKPGGLIEQGVNALFR